MKFGRIVLQVNIRRLMGPHFKMMAMMYSRTLAVAAAAQ